MPAVADSSSLIALHAIGRLDLMPEIFGRIAVPAAVAAEVNRFTLPVWIEVHQPSVPAVIPGVTVELGAGETGAILLALQLKSRQIILDDRDARTVAESLGLKVIGVLGLLIAAKRLGRLLLRPGRDG